MRAIYVGFLIFAVFFGLFIGYYIWVPTWQLPGEFQYQVLKDVLTIVLAVIAIGIALFSYLFYRLERVILENRIRESAMEMRRVVDIEVHRASARSYIVTGYAYWLQSKKAVERAAVEKGKKKKELAEEEACQYRNQAIDLTNHAWNWHASLLDDRERYNQRLICAIRNNLAYYLAERNQRDDLKLARNYAEYVRTKAHEFPLQRDTWLETYDFVLKQEALQEDKDVDHN